MSIGVVVIIAIAGGYRLWSSGSVSALLTPADELVTLPDGSEVLLSGRSALRGLDSDQWEGTHPGEEILPVTSATLLHPLRRRAIDPYVQLTNARIQTGVDGLDVRFGWTFTVWRETPKS